MVAERPSLVMWRYNAGLTTSSRIGPQVASRAFFSVPFPLVRSRSQRQSASHFIRMRSLIGLAADITRLAFNLMAPPRPPIRHRVESYLQSALALYAKMNCATAEIYDHCDAGHAKTSNR